MLHLNTQIKKELKFLIPSSEKWIKERSMSKLTPLQKAKKAKQVYDKYQGLKRLSDKLSEKLGTPSLPPISSLILKKLKRSKL
jgi:hypothetical protein